MNIKLKTNGNGLWSTREAEVTCTDFDLEINDGASYGEFKVFFDTKTWDITNDGLIYTDPGFDVNLRKVLHQNMNLSIKALKDLSYSEQGMQGDDYVSFDAGPHFIKEWEG